jgi:hypothetical protein
MSKRNSRRGFLQKSLQTAAGVALSSTALAQTAESPLTEPAPSGATGSPGWHTGVWDEPA